MRRAVDETLLRGVIAYKWLKGGVQIALAIGLSLTVALGLNDELQQWAHEFRNHSTRAYAVILGRVLERATTPRAVHITLAALWVDGIVTCIEAWALQRRRPWGAWLVVAVTGSLLPFEVYELTRHFRSGRVLVLLVNLGVVIFLAIHARAQARGLAASATEGPAPPPAPQPRGSAAGS